MTIFLGVALGLLSVGAWGQAGKDGASSVPVVGAVVSGRVTFADTNGPARFSKVLLKSVTPGGGDDIFSELIKDDDGDGKNGAKKKEMTPDEQAQRKEQMAGAAKIMAQLSDMLQATTVGGDGLYLFNDVKPGTYYVHAMAKGYIDPLAQFSQDELASKDPAMRKRIGAVATVVTVTGADGAVADLRLERGGSVSGRVLYDDGSPAVGWTVKTVKPAVPGEVNPFAAVGMDASDVDLAHVQEASVTDDTGYYRIAGLATGDYVVQARLQTSAVGRASSTPAAGAGMGGPVQMAVLKLTVYSGNAVKQSEAKSVEVKAGQNVADYDLTLPLRTLHALGGTVRARSDGHAVNAGRVMLSGVGADGKDDPGFHLLALVHEDGTFRFDYVPGPATYMLKVTGAADETVTGTTKVLGRTMPETRTAKSYGPGTATATVGDSDVTDAVVTVTEVGR